MNQPTQPDAVERIARFLFDREWTRVIDHDAARELIALAAAVPVSFPVPPTDQTALEADVDLTDGPVRCPLCPNVVTLHTPNGARAHFAVVHPEQRLTGRGSGPWPLLVTDEAEADVDQTARDRIRRVLCERDGNGSLWGTDMLEPDEYGEVADAVLGVLPSVVRARVLHDAAEGGVAERLSRVLEWVTGEVVTAQTEFGNGYRAAQRDIRDLIKGRFDNDAANELRRLAAEQPTNTEQVADVGDDHSCAEAGCSGEPTAEPPEPPTEEQTVRAHVLALHQIGEQLAGIESWMWERLADARDTEAQAAAEYARALATPPSAEAAAYIRKRLERPAVVEQPDTAEHVCKPGAARYFCPTSGKTESTCHGGFDVCCDRPDLHQLAGVERPDTQTPDADVASRVAALHQPMQRGPFTICAHCSGWDGEWRCLGVVTNYPCPTIRALAEPSPADPVHVGGGANAEDCPACSGSNPPYPFVCPSPPAP